MSMIECRYENILKVELKLKLVTDKHFNFNKKQLKEMFCIDINQMSENISKGDKKLKISSVVKAVADKLIELCDIGSTLNSDIVVTQEELENFVKEIVSEYLYETEYYAYLLETDKKHEITLEQFSYLLNVEYSSAKKRLHENFSKMTSDFDADDMVFNFKDILDKNIIVTTNKSKYRIKSNSTDAVTVANIVYNYSKLPFKTIDSIKNVTFEKFQILSEDLSCWRKKSVDNYLIEKIFHSNGVLYAMSEWANKVSEFVVDSSYGEALYRYLRSVSCDLMYLISKICTNFPVNMQENALRDLIENFAIFINENDRWSKQQLRFVNFITECLLPLSLNVMELLLKNLKLDNVDNFHEELNEHSIVFSHSKEERKPISISKKYDLTYILLINIYCNHIVAQEEELVDFFEFCKSYETIENKFLDYLIYLQDNINFNTIPSPKITRIIRASAEPFKVKIIKPEK